MPLSNMQGVTGERFQQGQHICVLYATRDEQIAVAAAYITEGLRNGERCMYVPNSASELDRFRQALHEHGIDAAAVENLGALILLTKANAHLVDGAFDAERMLKMLNDAVEQALNDGYTGLRTCGDMSWLLDEAPGSDRVIEYEAMLNQFFRNVRAIGMCQYDRRRLTPQVLEQAGLCTHSTVIIAGRHRTNPFFMPGIIPGGTTDAAGLDRKLAALSRS
jgi:hypothetical protein